MQKMILLKRAFTLSELLKSVFSAPMETTTSFAAFRTLRLE